MGREQYGSWGPINIGTPHARGIRSVNPICGPQKNRKTGLRHSRGGINKGKKPLGRERLRETAIEGLDRIPLCRGCCAHQSTGASPVAKSDLLM